jgi:hypothetical protein
MGSGFKKNVDQSKLSKDLLEVIEQNRKFGLKRGCYNKNIEEPIPTIEKAPCEIIREGKNNSFIILGRDRPHTPASGQGGKGATQAGRIDFIAGLASSYPHKDGTFGPPHSGTVVNPNFAMDAARVYISQKSHIDRYMGLAPVPLQSGEGSSAIGLKADAIRIHARQDIKIVTGRSRTEGLDRYGERLAHGGVNEVVGTISFIAGNHTEDRYDGLWPQPSKLQPLIKGDNLTNCLSEILNLIAELYANVKANTTHINQLNNMTGGHIHTLAAPAPIPTIPSPMQLPFAAVLASLGLVETASQEVLKKRVDGVRDKYLRISDGDPEPQHNIKSKFVFTT